MSKQLVKFISVWDGYGEVISDAIFDDKTNTISDIETADLSHEELAECEILLGEYIEFADGTRVEVLIDEETDSYIPCPF